MSMVDGGALTQMTGLLAPMAYLMGVGLALKGVIALKAVAEGARGSSFAQPMTLMCMSAAMMAFPTFMNTAFEEINPQEQLESKASPSEPKIVSIAQASLNDEKASAAQKDLSKNDAIAKAGKDEPAKPVIVAKAPIKIEKLATPEEARAEADQKALLEVLGGAGIALAVAGAIWAAARRRRGKPAAEALPDVQFLGQGEKSAFGAGDIFAKTAAFDKSGDGRA